MNSPDKQDRKRRFTKDALMLMGVAAANVCLSLVPTYFVLRILSVEQYGQVKLLLLVLSFTFLSEIGVAKALLRTYPTLKARGEIERLRTMAGATFTFVVLTGLVVCAGLAVVYLLGWRLENTLTPVLIGVACLQILGEKSFRVLQFVLVAEARFKVVSALRLHISLAGVLVIPGVYFFGVTGYFMAAALTEVGLAIAAWRLVGSRIRFSWNWTELKPLLKKGSGFWLIAIQSKAAVRMEMILIPIFLSLDKLAFFGVAFQAVNTAEKLFNPLNELIIQRAARDRGLDKRNPEHRRAYLESYLGANAILLFFISFVSLSLVYFMVRVLIFTILPKYTPAIPILLILSQALAFYRAFSLLRLPLVVTGHLKVLNWLTFATLSLKLVLGIGLIKLVGLTGLAWGVLATYCLIFIANSLAVYRVVDHSPRRGRVMAIKVLLAGGLSFGCIGLLNHLAALIGLPPSGTPGWYAALFGQAAAMCLIHPLVLLAGFALLFRGEGFWPTVVVWIKVGLSFVGLGGRAETNKA